MSDADTQHDGQVRSAFNTTHWTAVLQAGQENSPASALALEQLCQTYWYPLYTYARRQGYNSADGQDLTQQFFAVFLEKNYFSVAHPDRGRFRSFLLASFKHFLANEYNRNRAAKRGGGRAPLSWDAVDTEERYAHEPASHATPDRLFEQAWVLTLLGKVLSELKQEYVAAGKGPLFEALEVHLTGAKAEITYADIGKELAMSESAIKMAVLRLRQRYGERLRSEVAHTVSGAETVDDELRHLFRVLA